VTQASTTSKGARIHMTDTTDDTMAITALFERACAAWTAGDAHAYGECFTADSDYVSYDGAWARGRASMVDAHDRLFRGVLAGSALVGGIESVRFVRPDVAVAHATGSVLMPWHSKLPKRRLSRQTLVAVRTDDGWRFTALHNNRVRPVRIPDPGSLPAKGSQALARVARKFGAGRGRTGAQATRRPAAARS
jgi:uncharacterized protein (TIGR02246 family)